MRSNLSPLSRHWASHTRRCATPRAIHPQFIPSAALRSLSSTPFTPSRPSSASKQSRPKNRQPKTFGDQAEPTDHAPTKPKKRSLKRLQPPKRPMNIMQLVTQDVFAELKAKQGKVSNEDARESFRIAAEKYRSLSEADKQNYIDELERRRQKYEVEMREFLDALTPDDYMNQNEYIRRRKAQGRSTNRRGIPRLDPNAPKRPLNGFMIFCSDLRTNPSKFPELAELTQSLKSADKDGGPSLIEGSKALASIWKSMDEDVKQEYLVEGQRRSDLYKVEKAKYDAQIKSLSSKLETTSIH